MSKAKPVTPCASASYDCSFGAFTDVPRSGPSGMLSSSTMPAEPGDPSGVIPSEPRIHRAITPDVHIPRPGVGTNADTGAGSRTIEHSPYFVVRQLSAWT